jgi:hypothetical protein
MLQLLVSLLLTGQLLPNKLKLPDQSFLYFRRILIVTILQISGLTITSFGIGLFNIPAGIIATGVSLFLCGLALERGK